MQGVGSRVYVAYRVARSLHSSGEGTNPMGLTTFGLNMAQGKVPSVSTTVGELCGLDRTKVKVVRVQPLASEFGTA